MDLDKLLETLSPKEREALRKKLANDAEPELEPRLKRLEHAMFGPEGFDPFQMCNQIMGGFPPFGPARAVQPAQVFNALADETRLKIIRLLGEGAKNVDEIVQALGLAQSTTSHHLKVLKDAGLIQGEKQGRSVHYSLVQPLNHDNQTR